MVKLGVHISFFSVDSVDFRNVLRRLFGDRQGNPAFNKCAISKILFWT